MNQANSTDYSRWGLETSPDSYPPDTEPVHRQEPYWAGLATPDFVHVYFSMLGCDEAECLELKVSFSNQRGAKRFLDSIPSDILPLVLETEWGFTNLGLM